MATDDTPLQPPPQLDETVFRSLVEFSTVGFYLIQSGRFRYVNPKLAEIFGYTQEEIVATRAVSDLVAEEDRSLVMENIRRRVAGEIPQIRYGFRGLRKDGRPIDVEVAGSIIPGSEPPMILGTLTDQTEWKRAEATLKESERQLRSLFENAVIGIYRTTPDGRILMANQTLVRMLGHTSFEELATRDLESGAFVDTAERRRFREAIERDGEVLGFEAVWIRKDGTRIFVLENARAVRAEDGITSAYEGTVENIMERRALEAQLRQAQKMEAVGRLAGGIAHDFNNLLTVIGGYSDLLLMHLPESDPLHASVLEIRKAGERAAALTRQLLAFSRQQMLQPRLLSLNAVVTDLNKMLRRLIGEDIELLTSLAPGLGPVKADPGQIEQVILNLAVNSRDAMPDGGRLTIETRNVELDPSNAPGHFPVTPGSYVQLVISDTGSGMDAATQARVFEPFFTTKEKGKGTGLGLSTVYGIVKQSGGYIFVLSEPGHGTSFRIYLPRAAAGPARPPSGERFQPLPAGHGTILLVEDDPALRSLARVLLEENGYDVLVAQGGDEALAVSQVFAGPIDMMLTDVVMPGMSGRELADRISRTRAGLRVLFMSGYTDDAIVHHGVLDPGTAFLPKPFTPGDLVRKVRETLEAERGA